METLLAEITLGRLLAEIPPVTSFWLAWARMASKPCARVGRRVRGSIRKSGGVWAWVSVCCRVLGCASPIRRARTLLSTSHNPPYVA